MARWNASLSDRFWAKVDKTGECWTWTASKVPGGYGLFTPYGKGSRTYAHRMSWEIHHGAIPEGLRVLHSCDTPQCVRPDHLFLGTQKDNVADMIEKGRRVKANLLKTHCRNGHPYDDENTYRNRGERQCRTCNRERMRLVRAGRR